MLVANLVSWIWRVIFEHVVFLKVDLNAVFFAKMPFNRYFK